MEMGGEGDYIPMNDFCIKMGSDDSHLMFQYKVMDKVTKQCPQTRK